MTFDHRTILAGAKIPDVINDIQQLIIYIRNNSEELNIDSDNIAVWSFSGGVPFGLNVSLDLDKTYIKSLVIYYGPVNFEPLSELLNIKFDKQQSIVKYANDYPDKIPPLFIARAGLDMPVINRSINQFIEIALNLNLNITICNHATGHHAFDILDDTARTRDILGMTLSFLAKNLIP